MSSLSWSRVNQAELRGRAGGARAVQEGRGHSHEHSHKHSHRHSNLIVLNMITSVQSHLSPPAAPPPGHPAGAPRRQQARHRRTTAQKQRNPEQHERIARRGVIED